jgi:hypothetical protein
MAQPLLLDGLGGEYVPAFHNNAHPGNGRRCSPECQQQTRTAARLRASRSGGHLLSVLVNKATR